MVKGVVFEIGGQNQKTTKTKRRRKCKTKTITRTRRARRTTRWIILVPVGHFEIVISINEKLQMSPTESIGPHRSRKRSRHLRTR